MRMVAFTSPVLTLRTANRSTFRPSLPLRRSLRTVLVPQRRPRPAHRRPALHASAAPVPASSPHDLRGATPVITTPLFYVNAPPHMGSAYPTIAADALARFYRMAGASPTFVTGCDEHGEKIAAAAVSASPASSPAPSSASDFSPDFVQQFCDGVATKFDDLWDKLSIRYDQFVRTTNPRHATVVKQFMERVWQNGDIYKSHYEGYYCTGCEEYKGDSDLIEGSVCPIHLKPCDKRKEENYFFALSKYQDRLETFLSENPDFVVPAERRNEVLGWVKSGVKDFSVSRASNPWGIPMPRDQSQTIYVWFDALLGYISALFGVKGDPDEPLDLNNVETLGWPADVHIIGKDILRFHAVYWPAMLMSAGLPLPRRVVGHGFITKDGMKMGKSLGNTLDPDELVSTYGSDAVRYYFLKAVDFGKDGDFSEQRFVDTVNADLANSLGNMLSRSLNLLKKNCGGILPISSGDLMTIDQNEEEGRLRHLAQEAAENAFDSYQRLDFVGACESVMAICNEANSYIDRVAPWTKFKSKDDADVELAQRCVVNVMEACRIVAAGLSPVTPQLSRKVYQALGLEHSTQGELDWEQHMKWGILSSGMSFVKPKPVFPRLEITVEAAVAS